MTQQVEFFVPGEPAPKYGDRPRSYTATGAATWTDALALAASRVRARTRGMPWAVKDREQIAVQAVLWMPPPQTVKRDRPSVSPDIDKLARGLLDPLSGQIYQDDGRAVHLDVREFYASADQPPGCLLRVTLLDGSETQFGIPWWAVVPQRVKSLDAVPEMGAWS